MCQPNEQVLTPMNVSRRCQITILFLEASIVQSYRYTCDDTWVKEKYTPSNIVENSSISLLESI